MNRPLRTDVITLGLGSSSGIRLDASATSAAALDSAAACRVDRLRARTTTERGISHWHSRIGRVQSVQSRTVAYKAAVGRLFPNHLILTGALYFGQILGTFGNFWESVPNLRHVLAPSAPRSQAPSLVHLPRRHRLHPRADRPSRTTARALPVFSQTFGAKTC